MTMKRLLPVLAFLLLTPAVTALDLADYPDYFYKNGNFNAQIVVGEEAPSQDVASAVEMIPPLQQRSNSVISGATLDSEMTEYTLQSTHLISLGTPCDNQVTAKIMDAEEDCSSYFEEGTGHIYLYESPLGKAWMVVAGGTANDTEKAALVLAENDKYNLSGKAVEVKGEEAPFEITETSLPDEVEEETEETENQTEQVVNESKEVEVTDVDAEINETDVEVNASLKDSEELDREIEKLLKEDENLTREQARKKAKEANQEPNREEPEQVEESKPFYTKAWDGFKEWLMWFFR